MVFPRCPLEEASLGDLTEAILVLLRHRLIGVLGSLDLPPNRLQLFEVVEELELIELRDLDGAVLVHFDLLLIGFALFGRHLVAEVINHALIETVVEHRRLAPLPA